MRTSFLSRLSDDDQEQLESHSSDQPKNLIISRTHQYWPGTHRFFFKGKLITGPFRDTFIYYIFIAFLLIHALLFLFVLLPEVSVDLHMYFIILYTIFFIGSIVFYLLTAFTEPGLLPTKKFLNVRATLNKEDHQIEKLNLLTQFLQGYYASVLTLYWQRKWDTDTKKTFSEFAARPFKLKDMAKGTPVIPEVDAESEDQPRSLYSNHRDNAEYHDDILTYKSHSVKEEQVENETNKENCIQNSVENQKKDDEIEENKIIVESDINTKRDTLASNPVFLGESQKDEMKSSEVNFEKNWLLEEYKSKFCLHCQIYKTKHAVHCDHCNCCVRVHNHHCVFVNNCIGKRNYKHFLALISCLLFLNIYFIVAMFLAFPQLMLLDLTIFRSFIMLLFLQSVLVSGYCVFHLFLFFSFVINGEDPSRIREHSPLRSFLFKRLRRIKNKVNKSIRQQSMISRSIQDDNQVQKSLSGDKIEKSQKSSLNFNSNQSLRGKNGKTISLHELLSLSQDSIPKSPENPMNNYTIRAMNEITSGIKLLSGEPIPQGNLELKLSPADKAKLGQSKATKATTAEFLSQKSKKASEDSNSKVITNSPNLGNETLARRMITMFPGLFADNQNETVLGENLKKISDEYDMVVFNDRMTLDKLENEIKPPELAILEKEENYDMFSVSPSLINFGNELDINEANELAITRRIYMN